MSILRRVISDDLLPALRRRGLGRSTPSPVPAQGDQVAPETGARTIHRERGRSAGMTAVVLNWRHGENDPFTFVNLAIARHLRTSGKNVETIEITDEAWPRRIIELARRGDIDFTYTWQGLGSSAKVGDPPVRLWDWLRTPVICIHGDHPSHMPANHEMDSGYCFHLYANAEHARYANRHFRRARGARVIDIPRLHDETPLPKKHGDFFVVAKNLNHPRDMEEFWRNRLDVTSFEFYMAAAETLEARIQGAGYVEIHDVLDEMIQQNSIEWLDSALSPATFHQFHSQLDFYARNFRTVHAIASLHDVPLRIYGRGWDRIASDASPKHTFHPGQDMALSQDLYYSRFGIIDISPSRGLHDRTRRAMANSCGFLSSADLDGSFEGIGRFNRLFFDFAPDVLSMRCAEVMRDPETHATIGAEFGEQYHARFSPRAFVGRLEDLALIARDCAAGRPSDGLGQ